MLILKAVLIGTIGYLLGSVSTGMIISKIKGVDIRKQGSGNIGATNVYRTMGKTFGAIVLIGDALKGAVATLFGGWFLGQGEGQLGMMVGGLAVQTGHSYSIFLKGQGGKGIATGLGVLSVILPKTLLVALPLWLLVLFISGYVSLSSIIAAVSVPIVSWFFYQDLSLFIFASLAALLAIWRHKSNIQRLLKGEENNFKRKKIQKG